MTRAAVLHDRGSVDGIGQFAAMQGVAPSLGVVLNPVDVRDAGEIERAITTFARSDSGLIVTASGLAIRHRDLIVTLAARHKLPAVFAQVFALTARINGCSIVKPPGQLNAAINRCVSSSIRHPIINVCR